MMNKVFRSGQLLLVLLLSGCNEPTADAKNFAEAWQIESVTSQVAALDRRISQIEARDERLPFKLGDSGFGFLDSNTGGAAFQWLSATNNGNGTALKFKFGNPSLADWNRFSMVGRYGKLTADGNPDESTSKPFILEVNQKIPEGSWRTITVQLDGPKAENVGYLYLDSIQISNLSLRSE